MRPEEVKLAGASVVPGLVMVWVGLIGSIGLSYILGLALFVGCLLPLLLPRKPWVWIYDLIVICFGFTSVCFWPNPSTGQLTTVVVVSSETSPAAFARRISAAERRTRGVASSAHVTITTRHSGV